MNISSTPFIRNDYWPDYNDINQLNQRINEVENELSLTNIRLSANIENVSNDLNSYANNQANTTIANNIIVNNINANYAVGKFVNFGNANFDNAYVENLTVNKPVFDITLNTPHIENVTSLGGNIYDANMFNVSITGGNVAFNSVSIDDLTATNATISNVNILDGDVNLNKAVIGDVNASNATISNVNILDGNALLDSASINNAALNIATINAADILSGNVNLNNAVVGDLTVTNASISNVDILDGDVNLNKAIIDNINASNATISNLFVNTQSEPVTSSAVLGYDSEGRVIPIHASYDVGFPEDANYLFTDHAGTAFAGIAATEVSAVDNLITAQAVQNGFNDINANVQNGFNNLANNLAEEEQIDMNNIVSHILPPTVVNYFNSESPLNYQGITDVNYNAGSFTSPYYLGNNVYMRLNGTTLEFSLPVLTSDLFYTGQSAMYITSNRSMRQAFYNCESLNQNILIPNSVTDLRNTFSGCSNLNQNILIPNSVTHLSGIFTDCSSLNQNILIPNSVGTIGLNRAGLKSSAFIGCTSLNQSILIPNSATMLDSVFEGCTNLNQRDMYIYSQNIKSMKNTYLGVQYIGNIHIPTSVPKDTSNFMYNCLVNGNAGYTFAPENIINDLPVDIAQWPPEV